MQVRDFLGPIYDNIRRLRRVRDQANTMADLLEEDQAPLADTACASRPAVHPLGRPARAAPRTSRNARSGQVEEPSASQNPL